MVTDFSGVGGAAWSKRTKRQRLMLTGRKKYLKIRWGRGWITKPFSPDSRLRIKLMPT
jgi:hypothetical protein